MFALGTRLRLRTSRECFNSGRKGFETTQRKSHPLSNMAPFPGELNNFIKYRNG